MSKIRAFPGSLDRSGIGGKIMLTDEQLAWMTQYFPKIENSRLMEASGLTHSTLHRIARSYHLTKSVSGLRAIKRRQAKHIKQVCEANGYYDSLRGKPVSEACREGTRRLWASGFHPTKNMSKRRYRQYIHHKSESRKELLCTDYPDWQQCTILMNHTRHGVTTHNDFIKLHNNQQGREQHS